MTGEHDSEFGARPAPGEGLVEAMRAVPSMFFEEDFSLARRAFMTICGHSVTACVQAPGRHGFAECRPGTWREVVSTEGEAQRLARLDEYSGYLDVVESQLLKEIAARSEHFFEAAGVVQVGQYADERQLLLSSRSGTFGKMCGAQDLRATLHRTYSQVTALRRGVGLLRADTQRASEAAMCHKRRKANMKAVLDKLKVHQSHKSA